MQKYMLLMTAVFLGTKAFATSELQSRAIQELQNPKLGIQSQPEQTHASSLKLDSPPPLSPKDFSSWSLGLSLDSYNAQSSSFETDQAGVRPRIELLRTWGLNSELDFDLGPGFSLSRQNATFSGQAGQTTENTFTLRSRLRKTTGRIQGFVGFDLGQTNLGWNAPNSVQSSKNLSLVSASIGIGAKMDFSSRWALVGSLMHQEKIKSSELDAAAFLSEIGVLIKW